MIEFLKRKRDYLLGIQRNKPVFLTSEGGIQPGQSVDEAVVDRGQGLQILIIPILLGQSLHEDTACNELILDPVDENAGPLIGNHALPLQYGFLPFLIPLNLRIAEK